MASEHSFLDIHICGPCRSEFNDILKFIQHKKECYLSAAREQGQVQDLPHLTEHSIQHFHASDGLEPHLVNVEFHPEIYQYSAASSLNHLENEDSSQASVQISVSSGTNGTDHSMSDRPRKDQSQFSYTPLVSEHKSVDVAALYSYSWPAEPDIRSVSASMRHVAENELALVTDATFHIQNSINGENASEDLKNNLDISTDNIAVYVMSPKSFASSIRAQSKSSHNSRSKSLSDFSSESVWAESQSESDHQLLDSFAGVTTIPIISSRRSHITLEGDEQHTDLIYFHHENTGSELQKPVAGSGFYNTADLVPGPTNVTPCPEDLKVGHASTAMFGKKKQQENFKIVLNVSNAQTTSSVVSQSDSYFKILLDDVESGHGYIRERAADVPIIEVKKRLSVQSKQRISTEKRERLQGVSDDLLVSPVKLTSASGTRNQQLDLRQTPGNQLGICATRLGRLMRIFAPGHAGVKGKEIAEHLTDVAAVGEGISVDKSDSLNGVKHVDRDKVEMTDRNITSSHSTQTSAESIVMPALTSYKAIFTSPSSGGHRLTATQTESINCSVQGFSNLKKQLFTSGSNSLVSKSVEYKNISSSIQGNQCDGQLSCSDSSLVIRGKHSERQVNCETNAKQLTQEPNSCGFNFSPLALSAILGHAKNATQVKLKPTNEIKNQKSSITTSLNNALTGLNKVQSSMPFSEGDEHHLNTDFNVEVGVADGATHHVEDSPVIVMNNTASSQVYTGESLNNNSHVGTNPGTKADLTLAAHKDESSNALLPASADNTSIVMVYKNSDGHFIMVPNMLCSGALQTNSQTAEILQAVRAATSKAVLSFESGNQHSNLVQQQTSDSSGSLDAITANDNLSIVSQHYYIQNLDTHLLNPSQVLSNTGDSPTLPYKVLPNIDDSPTLPNSSGSYIVNQATSGSYIVNQATSVTANRNCSNTATNKLIKSHKAPVPTAILCGPAALEKEKYIVKQTKSEGSSRTSLEFQNMKRTVQASPVEELVAIDVTNQGGDKKPRSFACIFDLCRYTTSSYKDFQRHCRRHTGEKPYQCGDCGLTFNRSDKLKLHQRRHTGLKPFQCHICDYAAIEGGSLKKHMRIHTDARPFKCQICTYASRNSSQLIVHLRTHTGDSPFHCTKCTAKFKINSDLKRHMRIHTGEKPFQCDQCDYKSSNKGNLKTHLRINHLQENEIHCPMCKFVTSSKKRLKEHKKSHNVQVMKCPQCDYTCATSGQLRSHIIIHNSVKPFRCNLCSYSSKQSGNLKKHIHNMHLYKVQGRSRNSAATLENGVKLHGTRRENVLLPIAEISTTHKRRSSASCRKLHTCEQCGSKFVREDSLRCHRKQHCAGSEEQGAESKNQSQLEPVNVDSESVSTENGTSQAFYGHQGIQQIVAAASKIYEENFGVVTASTRSPTANMSSFVLKTVPDFRVGSSIKDNLSSTGIGANISATSTVNEARHQKAALLQVPWQHRSYTLSDYDKSPHGSIKPPSSNFATKTHPNLLKAKISQNRGSNPHHSPSAEDASHHPEKQQASKQHSPHLLKRRKVEDHFPKPRQPPDKPFQNVNQSTQLRLQETHQHLLVPQTSDELPGMHTTESAAFLAQQGTDGGSADSFYNIQLVPQYEPGQREAVSHRTQELHELPPGATHIQLQPAPHIQLQPAPHIQLQPAPHIQIVLPRTLASKSCQLVREPGSSVISQPQILLQVQENSEESQLFTIPTGNLNTLQTTGQVLPIILSHCISQQNGQVDLQSFNHADTQPSSLHAPSTKQLVNSAPGVISNNVHGSDSAQV